MACLGAGVFGSPVALRLGLDAEVVAEKVAEEPGVLSVEASRGFLTVRVRPGDVVRGVLGDSEYGWAEVPGGSWSDRPRTFENPGFRVRYAFARAVAVRRRALDLGVEAEVGEPEALVVECLGDLPGRARQAERERDPGALMRCLERLADAYHGAYERDAGLSAGHVALARAVEIALGNGLKMIGENPRERI